MNHFRTDEEVHNYDIFKGVVTGLLLITLFITAVLGSDDAGDATASSPDAVADGELSDAGESAVDFEEPEDSELTAPDLLSPAPGAELTAGPETFSGMGHPNSQVVLLADGSEIGKTLVDESGTWNMEVVLADGVEEIQLQTLDSSGNVAASSPPIPLTVVAEGAEQSVTQDFTVDPLPQGTRSAVITVSGTGEPGYKVAVDVNGMQATMANIGEDGVWSVEVNAGDDAAEVTVRYISPEDEVLQTVTAGQLEASATISAAVDLPEQDLRAGDLTLSGTGQPGEILRLMANGIDIGTAVVGEDGTWTMAGNLPEGEYDIDVATLDDAGNILKILPAITLPVLKAVAPEESEAETPAEGEAETPTEGEAETPAEGEAETPAEGEAETPAEGETETPAEGESETPAEGESETPAEGESETPAEGESETPAEGESETPAEGESETPAEGEAETPSEGEAETPSEGEAETPSEGEAETPAEGETETPAEGEAETPAEGEADVDLEEDAESALEATEEAGSFSTLVEGLEAAGLTQTLSDIDGKYTLFAPTNEAFEALPPGIIAGWQANPEEYRNIMRYQVVEGSYTPEELTDGLVLQSIGGTNIGIEHKGDLVFVNGVPVVDVAEAGGSVVYALPQVILPPLPAGVSAPLIDVSGVLIFTGELLTVVGHGEPGTRVVLAVDNERFGAVATVREDGFWEIKDDIGSGIHTIVAYMIDDQGLVRAASAEVSLAVQ